MDTMENQSLRSAKTGLMPGEARCPGITIQQIVAKDLRPPPPVLAHENYRFLGDADIPVEGYYTREAFDQERDKLWPRAWQWACREEHIPEIGDSYLYEIVGYSILVVRTKRGIKAYFNSCLHRSTKFVTGEGQKQLKQIRCPFHGWAWKLDGSLLNIPCAWDFPHVDPEKFALPEVRVGLWGGFVFINMDAEAESLEDFLAPIPEHFANWPLEDLFVEVHIAKVLPANWKLAQEAFVEAYHSMQTHPQIMRTVTDANIQYDVYSETVSRFYSAIGVSSPLYKGKLSEAEIAAEMVSGGRDAVGTIPMAEGETARSVMSRVLRDGLAERYGRNLSSYSDSEVIDGIEYSLFPNMFLFPGLSLPMVYRFRPNGMDTESSVFEMLWLRPTPQTGARPAPAQPIFLGEATSFSAAAGLDPSFAIIYDQDVANLRAQQEGLRTARKGQTLANYQEMRIRHFHLMLDRFLNEANPSRNAPL